MTDFQKRAKEAADELAQVLDGRSNTMWWVDKHGPTALAALRAVSRGKKGYWINGVAYQGRYDGSLPCIIVEEPNE